MKSAIRSLKPLFREVRKIVGEDKEIEIVLALSVCPQVSPAIASADLIAYDSKRAWVGRLTGNVSGGWFWGNRYFNLEAKCSRVKDRELIKGLLAEIAFAKPEKFVSKPLGAIDPVLCRQLGTGKLEELQWTFSVRGMLSEFVAKELPEERNAA